MTHQFEAAKHARAYTDKAGDAGATGGAGAGGDSVAAAACVKKWRACTTQRSAPERWHALCNRLRQPYPSLPP